ncbi:MAG: HlyD family efflux transporter periplasmic adaptor subunit [Bacteroidota bacterium]
MDRALPNTIQQQRQRKKWWIAIASVAAVLALMWMLRSLLANSVDESRILTAIAENGPMESTLTASGEVSPEFEQVITSAIRADIQEVILGIGSVVEPNMQVLSLDKAFALLDYQKLRQEWELKENGIKKLRLELKKQSFQLLIADSTQQLDILQLETQLEDAKRLKNIGGGTQESISLIETKLQKARLEKRKLEFNLSIEQQQTQTKVRELELQSQIQASALKAMEEKLKRANVVAKRAGVITWVNENIGTTVNEGDILARIADLSSFKIIATCSNIYADRIRLGMEASIPLNQEERIQGKIVNIRPTAENNTMTFDIQLSERNHALLRPNLKVDIHIITASKGEAVRVANGPAFNGKASQDLFVVENGIAIRRKVEVGMVNFDYVEIEKGIQAGETVIISDMERYEHVSEIKIR